MTETLLFDDITLMIAPIDRSELQSRAEAERRTVDMLLKSALGPDAVLRHHESGAPYIADRQTYISVSHCSSHACIAISEIRPVGADIEQQRQQLARVAPRVLSPDELTAYSTSSLLLRAWTLKEALYKAALTPGLDFRNDIRLPLPPGTATSSADGRDYEVVASIETADYTLSLVAPATSNKLS